MKRRHVTEADRARLPKILGLADWTAGEWRIGPADSTPDAAGHHDDFLADLDHADGKTSTRVVITSYDLDGRNDQQLADWIARKTREAAADALRARDAAADSPLAIAS